MPWNYSFFRSTHTVEHDNILFTLASKTADKGQERKEALNLHNSKMYRSRAYRSRQLLCPAPRLDFKINSTFSSKFSKNLVKYIPTH